MRLRFQNFEDVFLAGLLHNVGIVMEDQYVHEAFVSVMLALLKESDLLQVEQQHLGFDHTRLGEAMATAWKLPNFVSDSIRHHHDSTSYKGQYLKIVQFVEVANFICSLKDMPSVGINLTKFPRAAILALELGKEDLVVLANDLDAELANNVSLFQI